MKDKKGFSSEEGLLQIDTSIWMRPKTACNYLEKKGVSVSLALMNYWRNQGKIKSINVKELENLTLVDITTIPEEISVLIK